MWWWSAPGRPARSQPGGSPRRGWRSRSSRTGWSAASARSGRACPRRRCCGPYEALAEVKRIPGAADAVTGKLDVAAVLARRDEIIHDLDDDAQLPWLDDRGIELLRGHGRLSGERRVIVDDEEIEARRAVFLAPGSAPAMPPIPGLHEFDGAWTNRDATIAHEIPEHLVVLGGGVVGVEISQAFQTLGSQVTLIEGARRLLPRRGGVRLHPADGGAARVRRRHPHGAEGRAGRAERRRHGHGHDDRRRRGDRRQAARRARPHAADQGPRPRGRRAEPGEYDPGRRALPRARPRLAVRDRRRQRQRAVHPHGQVPGADRRRPRARPRPRDRPRRRRPALAAGHLHRAAGRGGRPHRPRRARRPGSRSRSSRPRPRATPAAPSTAATRRARRAGSSTASGGSSSAARSPAPRSPTSCTRRRSRSSARCRSSGCATRSRRSRPAARSG